MDGWRDLNGGARRPCGGFQLPAFACALAFLAGGEVRPARVGAFGREAFSPRELYFTDPDNIHVQLQDIRYRDGAGPLGDRDPG